MWKKVLMGWMGVSMLLTSAAGAEQTPVERAGYLEPPPFQNASEPVVPQTGEQYVSGEVQEGAKKIVINLANCSLSLYKGDTKAKLYAIAVGKVSTPTPVGYYTIRTKDINPTWIDPNDPEFMIPSGEENPLGYRWMEIQGNYGIHGTNKPESIGHYVSNGCIRMHEHDVEELFDLVEIDTPVEITYNRVVVEKTPESTVAYYIYPDNYGWQDVTVDMVNNWLKGYGIQNFESDEAIQNKINASDGEPTFIGKVYGMVVNGKRIQAKAVMQNNVIYIPALPIANELKVDLSWNKENSTLKTAYGSVPGLFKKGDYYVEAVNASKLFKLMGALQSNNYYVLNTIKEPTPQAVPSTNQRPQHPAQAQQQTPQQQVQQPQQSQEVNKEPVQQQAQEADKQPAKQPTQQQRQENAQSRQKQNQAGDTRPWHQGTGDASAGQNAPKKSDDNMANQQKADNVNNGQVDEPTSKVEY